jgi:hypothetical protein
VASAAHYLPVTITPTGASDIAIAVFEGITADATPNGAAFTAAQKADAVNAVWNINRVNGSGNANIVFNWDAALEGSNFTSLSDGFVGIAAFNGSAWSVPSGTGNNTSNTVFDVYSTLNAFYVGKNPNPQSLTFNPLPVKTYGDADFAPGAVSTNNVIPIAYTSSNTAVATIVSGNINIVGAGAADITAKQGTLQLTRTLTVNPAALTITADNKTKYLGDANPVLTITYNGFVNGETVASLITPPVISTTATAGSGLGIYPITVSGATAVNYTITFVNGTLTISPYITQTITFNTPAAKTYGNADFSAGATSTNTTIPIIYASSNTGVATVTGNTIHITGAGITTITASQAGAPPYSAAAPVQQVLTVSKASLNIRANDQTRTQGAANPVLTVTYTGFVNGDNAAALTTPPVIATAATAGSLPGNYPVTVSGAASPNYSISYTNGTLTVLPADGVNQASVRAYSTGNSNGLRVTIYNPNAPLIGAVQLFDMNGQWLITKKAYVPTGFTTVLISDGQITSGIYIVTVGGIGMNIHTTVNIIH